jgi:histidinol-phosphatase (PHP family)
MLYDTHLHTDFSTDSRMTLAAAVARGRELGLGLTVTEHMDLDFPTPKAFLFDIDEYFRSYGPERSDSLLLGIEIGMRPDLVRQNANLLVGRSFDFVIGSIHVVDGIDIYLEDFYLGRSKPEVFGHYFDSMQACLDTYDFIDSLGHIDYITRYARFPDPEIYYGEFADYLDAILERLATLGKAIEINTRRLTSADTVAALLPIYHRFRQLGGRHVTIGSDAHKPADIGNHFALAFDMAEACGLKPVYFKNRQPEYMKR